jgi:hypothetical protein
MYFSEKETVIKALKEKREAYLECIKIAGSGVTLPWLRTLIRNKLEELERELDQLEAKKK